MQAPTYHLSMATEGPSRYGSAESEGLRAGLLSALMLAIPLWAAIGICLVLLVAQRPLAAAESTALVAAGIVELLLLRYAWSRLGWRFGLREAFAGPAAGARTARRALLRQTSLLVGVVGAYLHYYFWDVYLQIESLNSVTVFVAVTRFG